MIFNHSNSSVVVYHFCFNLYFLMLNEVEHVSTCILPSTCAPRCGIFSGFFSCFVFFLANDN